MRTWIHAAIVGLLVLLLPAAASAAPEVDDSGGLVPSVRYGGEDRFATAAELALEFTAARSSDPATSVILATGENFPDALAGAYLSGQLDAPILLTRRDELPAATRALLTDGDAFADVDTVHLLGGPVAIGAAVEQELDDLGFQVVRSAGEDRAATAADIVRTGGGVVGEVDGLRTAIVATDAGFPDALVAGAAARGSALPLLLTSKDVLPRVTLDTLDDLGVDQVLIPGGTVAVSQEVQDELEDRGYATRRIAGETRTGTAVAFARFNVEELGHDTATFGLAVGNAFPDALALAPLAGRDGFSVLLSATPDTLGFEAAPYLRGIAACDAERVVVAGGPAALGTEVVDDVRRALTPTFDCDVEDTFVVDTTDDAGDADVGDGTCATEDGACSLRAAIQEANSDPAPDAIELGPEEYRLGLDGADEDAAATGDLDVVASVVIRGDRENGTTITAEDVDDRVLDVRGGVVTIQDVTVTGGAPTGDDVRGGGIRAVGDDTELTVLRSSVIGNRAAQAGGGIENTGASVTVLDSSINDNDTGSTPGNGGGVHAAGGSTLVEFSTIADNRAEEGGGAWVGDGTMTLEAVTLEGNEALGGDAGAGQRQGGGGVFAVDATLDVVNVTFRQNVAVAVDGAGSGGGILATTSGGATSTTVVGSTFEGNTADRAGGAIENDGGAVLAVRGTTLRENRALGEDGAGNGGGIHTIGPAVVELTTAIGNVADEGGALWVGGDGSLVVRSSTFEENEAEGDPDDVDGGGAVSNTGATLAVEQSTFRGNIAFAGAGAGGAIMTTSGGETTIAGSTFEANRADRAGGAVQNDGSTTVIADSLLRDNRVLGTSGPSTGGAVNDDDGTLTVSGSFLERNAAGAGGGLWSSGSLTVVDTDLTANTATDGGGDLHGSSSSSIVLDRMRIEAPDDAATGVSVVVAPGAAVDVSAGGNELFGPAPSCNRVIGSRTNGNTDDDGTCFS